MHPFSSKCLFRKMSWRDMDDEFIQETIQFLLWTSIGGGGSWRDFPRVIAHHTIGIKEQLGLGCSSQLHHQTTYSSFASRRDILSQYKNALAPLFDLRSRKKKIPIEVSNVNLCLFTALMLPNLIVVGIKTSEINFQLSCHAGTT